LLGLAVERTVDDSLQCISERMGGSSLQRAAGGRMSQAEQNAERKRGMGVLDGLLVPSVGCRTGDGFQSCVGSLL